MWELKRSSNFAWSLKWKGSSSKFYCRQLGSANHLGSYGNTIYSMPIKFTDRLPITVKQVSFVRRLIHGLSFVLSHFENAKPQEQSPVDVMKMYSLYKTEAKTVVA